MHLKGNRTAIECRLKWTNQVHPDLKTGGAGKVTWTPDETKKLERFTRKYGECGAWREIAAGVGARTALQCFQKWRKIKLGIMALFFGKSCFFRISKIRFLFKKKTSRC